MTTYTITNIASGIVLGQYEAATEAEALDLMARDAGYADYASVPEEIGGGDDLVVTAG
ncbi:MULTISPECIES: hypothetical protein [Sphingomonas]|uniref:hypothetical protein n=1 Tax=Sphingomonas TaxID=13687 RepID=UPI002549E379|nr:MULTISPECIES: hypothetical protein [Sphingomonas]MDK8188153.1 hypothetical protein [Sphingomonas zeae]MDK8217850.1 hypothetical protein [Sphingomonas sp. UMB7805-LC452B]